jgi:hypothetical protein
VAVAARLARSHAALLRTRKQTKALLEKDNTQLIPPMTAGAALAPLGVFFVDNSPNAEVRSKDLSNRPKLQKEAALALARPSADPTRKEQLALACRSPMERAQRVASHGGRKVARQEVKEQRAKWREAFNPANWEPKAKKQKRT